MLEVRNLDAGYGQVQVLRGIDIDVQEGEIVAVLGSNGAGKSTLNNNISGLFKPFGGAIRFQGHDITGNAPADAYRNLGYLHLKEKDIEGAKEYFTIFLEREPDATDRAMIEFYINEG